MSLVERVKARNAELAERVLNQTKTLTLDIETSNLEVQSWDLKPNYIHPDRILKPSGVICFAAKWYHEDVQFYSDHHDGHEKSILRAWELLDECDNLVTFNGDKFDIKHLNREFLLAKLPPPKPFKSIDLYKLAKKQFAFESGSLNYLARRLDVGEKVKHEGFDLWNECLAGDDDAWDRMRAYNMQDVVLTEAVYDELRGWMPTHPHMGSMDPDEMELTCNQCGSDDLLPNGLKRASLMDYPLYRCNNCGANVQSTSASARIARTRGA